jgi:hypothetical protein
LYSIFIATDLLKKQKAPAPFPMRAPLNLAEPDPRSYPGDATLLSGRDSNRLFFLLKGGSNLHAARMSASVMASVVFLKVHDFARRPVSEQARLRAQLEAVVAVTTAEIDRASRIVLDATDGMAIVVLRDPQGALRLAGRALSAAVAGLPVSAGVDHGAVRVIGNGKPDAMVGDGIAVAAAVAQFAPPSELRVSHAFRDALSDAAPGAESSLVPAGTATDSGLRRHELFTRDRRAAARRRMRYSTLSVAAALALLAAGIGARVSEQGYESVMSGVAGKYRAMSAQGERRVRALAQKVKLQ